MDTLEPRGSERKNADGTEIRGDKILSANHNKCVEDSYTTAYNLGCGSKKWDGWINVDIAGDCDIQCDLRKLEIASDTADAVCAIHVIEHFYAWEVADVLTEWKRVLRPGGKMILELPCMNKVFDYVLRCVQKKLPMDPFMTLLAMYGDPKHKRPEMCHKWGWFTEQMIEMLKSVGMRNIQVVPARYHFPFRDMRLECQK